MKELGNGAIIYKFKNPTTVTTVTTVNHNMISVSHCALSRDFLFL